MLPHLLLPDYHATLLHTRPPGITAQPTLTEACAACPPSRLAGANNTWWNVLPRNNALTPLPVCEFGPLLNFVGNYGPPSVRPDRPEPRGEYKLFPGWCSASTKWWVENIRPGARLVPTDLFTAMLATREKRLRR